MKKLILFLFLFTISIEAQETFMLQPVVINPADASKFEMIQKKYAKNLAQDAVNEGLLKGWALLGE